MVRVRARKPRCLLWRRASAVQAHDSLAAAHTTHREEVREDELPEGGGHGGEHGLDYPGALHLVEARQEELAAEEVDGAALGQQLPKHVLGQALRLAGDDCEGVPPGPGLRGEGAFLAEEEAAVAEVLDEALRVGAAQAGQQLSASEGSAGIKRSEHRLEHQTDEGHLIC